MKQKRAKISVRRRPAVEKRKKKSNLFLPLLFSHPHPPQPPPTHTQTHTYTQGRIVKYETGSVKRVGRIVKVLTEPSETKRPPKVVYECFDAKKKKTKQFTNNPSMLRVVDSDEEEEEEGEEEEEEEEEGAGGEGEREEEDQQ